MAENVAASEQLSPPPPFSIGKSAFVWGVHALAIVSLALWIGDFFTVSWQTLVLAFVVFALGSTTITAGYHRLFAHPTYTARWPLRLFHLIVGLSSVQGSAKQWAAQHRDHHTYCDQEKDPYNIKLGFWHAHLGWVLRQTTPDYSRVPDLEKDWMIRVQHALFVPGAILFSFVVPAAIGSLWGEAWGALCIAGFVRLVIQWHMTFCVNSVAHYWGSQKFSQSHTARGSWWLAFLVWGEMDHNYHHTYPNDFRTGTRWYDFDPGKWFITVCTWVGLAYGRKRAEVRSAPSSAVEAD